VGTRYLADELNHHYTTTRLGREAFREQARVRAAMTTLAVPTLVIHGEADTIVPPAASSGLESVASVTRRTWPGLRHEMHNEPEWESVIDTVIDWMRERLGALGRPAETPVLDSGQPNIASGERSAR
jgi:alpha-beta hydrolase superfamily lysophospholipase